MAARPWRTIPLPRTQTIFFTDRSLYRPGQTVRYRGLCISVSQANDNYEVLGNSMHQLHAHVHARYAWEPERFRQGPVWRYPDDLRPARQ